MSFPTPLPIQILAQYGARERVICFLFVSGYSIAASLSRNSHSFYSRRFWRIYPLYFAAVIFSFLLERALGGTAHLPSLTLQASSVANDFGNLAFLQSSLCNTIAFNIPLWSMAIEVAYYVIAPYLVRTKKWVWAVLLIVSVLSYLAPPVSGHGAVLNALANLKAMRFAWAWLAGLWLFSNRSAGSYLAVAALSCAAILTKEYSHPVAFALITVVLTLVIMWISGRIQARVWIGTRILGDLSYPVYLFHFPIILTAASFFRIANVYALLAIALVASAIPYFLVDVYLRRWLVACRQALRPASFAAQLVPSD